MRPATLRRAFFVGGALLAVLGSGWWWHGERVFARMRVTTCRLEVKSVEPRLLVHQRRWRRSFDFGGERARLRYRDEGRLVFTHALGGRRYTFVEEVNGDHLPLGEYEKGGTYPCRYDPENPAHATIETAFDREGPQALIIIAALLALLGFMAPEIWRQTVEGLAKMRHRI